MAAITGPKHGFGRAEFEARLARAQAAMQADRLDALVVTAPPNVRYFTGWESQFWESPTRPWYVVVPREGGIILVFPEIGVPAARRLPVIADIRSWQAPNPADDGISLMASVLQGLPRRFGRIGWEFGREMLVRAPRIDVDAMAKAASGLEFCDGSPTIWGLRAVKSEGEIDRIRTSCRIASAAFGELPKRIRIGETTRRISHTMARMLLELGADHVPFLATIAGPGGYDQIIAAPSDQPVRAGDVMILDCGATYDGYFCDFDRNFAFGTLAPEAARAHEVVWQATEAGMQVARPGATMEDIWQAMNSSLIAAGSQGNNVGRLGHSLGMQLTEPPSVRKGDTTRLVPGMVITIEPGMEYAPGKMIVHEENVVIRDGACEILTERAPREMPLIEA